MPISSSIERTASSNGASGIGYGLVKVIMKCACIARCHPARYQPIPFYQVIKFLAQDTQHLVRYHFLVLRTAGSFHEPVPVFAGTSAEDIVDGPLRLVGQVVEKAPHLFRASLDVTGFGNGIGHTKGRRCWPVLPATEG